MYLRCLSPNVLFRKNWRKVISRALTDVCMLVSSVYCQFWLKELPRPVVMCTQCTCVCVQWLFLKLCGTQWTGDNKELTHDTDEFIKSKGNLLICVSAMSYL